MACVSDLSLIFNFSTIAKVLSRLVEITPLPPLFMYTVIASLKSNPKLITTVVVQVLKRCVDKKIWLSVPSTDSTGRADAANAARLLWKGFVRCVKDCAQHDQIIAILRSLPQKQLLKVLRDDTQLHTAFTMHMAKFDNPPARYMEALVKTKRLPKPQAAANEPDGVGASAEQTEAPVSSGATPVEHSMVAGRDGHADTNNNNDDDVDDDDDDGGGVEITL